MNAVSPPSTYPDDLVLNAWTGDGAAAARREGNPGRAAGRGPRGGLTLAAAEAPDFNDISHPLVGWGLIMADDPAGDVADLAAAKDAPDCIQELVRQRAAAVLRWSAGGGAGQLSRCLPDGTRVPVPMAGAPRGMGRDALPLYLMIFASPARVPWSVQYALNLGGAVGRLDLEGEALDNYVGALLGEWAGSRADVSRPLVWATDNGPSDITAKMRQTIAEPLHDAFARDGQIGERAVFLAGQAATGAALAAALASQKPGLVVTTSHGDTSVSVAPAVLAASIGTPIDAVRSRVGAQVVLGGGWEPDGAIWYAHACCSAGADGQTSFRDIIQAYPGLAPSFDAATRVGPRTAPLAQALLGARRPLRAFIGHIEPTFDWTLADSTGRSLTSSLKTAFYDRQFQPRPDRLGRAMQAYFSEVGVLYGLWNTARNRMLTEPGAGPASLRYQLSALDRQSMVILGDPSVALPSLPSVAPPSLPT